MLEVEKGDESPADVGDGERKEEAVGEEQGRAGVNETEEEDPNSGVEREDASSGESGDEEVNPGEIESKKKKKKKKDKKPKSSKSLKRKKKDNDNDTKPISSKSLEKEGKKPKSSTSLKKKKKAKEKDETKKKKKGDSKKKLVRDEAFEHNNDKDNTGSDEQQQENDQNAEVKEQQKGDAMTETPSTEKGETPTGGDGAPSCASVSTSTVTDDSAIHKSMMTSLRRSERARASREIENVYDSDDDGLWVGTKEDTPRKSEASRISGGTTSTSKSRKNKKKRSNKPRKSRCKSDWETSVAADDSHVPYDSDYSDEDYSNRDYSSRSMMSNASTDQHASVRSSGRSHRSMSGRSHRSMSGRSFRSSSDFQKMKQDRNSSVKKSIFEDEVEDTFSVPSSKAFSRIELRKDLEAQARQRVEKNSSQQEKGEILANLRKSIHRISSVFESSAVDTKFLEEVGISDDEEKGTEDSDDKDKSKGDDKNTDDTIIKKLDRKQKLIALKEKARSRTGYIIIISVFVTLFVIANIILIVYLKKE